MSTLECILTDETANDVTRIFEADRERAPYLKQTWKECHIINKQKKKVKKIKRSDRVRTTARTIHWLSKQAR